MNDNDLRAVCARLTRETREMRDALVRYYRTETAYAENANTHSYGRYLDASNALIALAKRIVDKEDKAKEAREVRGLFT